MARSLSEDLRRRLVAAVESGLSRRAAAERFGVSAASAVRWTKAWRESGSVRAKRQGGDQRSRRIETYREAILGAVAERVDVTLCELVQMLRERHGAVFAPSSVWRFLDRHAMTVKKNSARQRAGAARRRRAAQRLGGGAA
jgi:transposase